MRIEDKAFWFFSLAFFFVFTLLAVYMKEPAIAAFNAFLLGTSSEKFQHNRPRGDRGSAG